MRILSFSLLFCALFSNSFKIKNKIMIQSSKEMSYFQYKDLILNLHSVILTTGPNNCGKTTFIKEKLI